MNALLKLNTECISFINGLNVNKDLIKIAVAKTVSEKLALPVEQPEDLDAYFNDNLNDASKNSISEINELIVIDALGALELTRMFWKLRQYVAHPKQNRLSVSTASSFADVLGFNTLIDAQTLAVLSNPEHCFAISKMITGFHSLLDTLSETKE